MPRVFSLLLLCASTVLGAHLRRAATSTAVVCPTQRPTSGESCRAVQHCEYDFIQTPDSNKDFECTGSLTCLPMTTCFCSGDNVWECRDISGDSLSGCSNFPEGRAPKYEYGRQRRIRARKKKYGRHDKTGKASFVRGTMTT
eukprot:scaffold1067_cov150-Amphora_coffeaeformis.AAC.2